MAQIAAPGTPSGETHHRVRPTVLPVRVDGAGPTLLMVHGLLGTSESFDLVAASLGQRYRLVIPDLRGHGRSRHLPGQYDAEALAADLVPTLDAHGIEKVHVLGYSHGGATAQVFAATHPSRVNSLVLVSTYTLQQLTWWERLGGLLAPPTIAVLGTRRVARLVQWRRTAGGGRRLSQDAAALGAAVIAANDGWRMARALRAARRFDSRGWLGALQVPTLIVVGEHDAIVAPRQARLLAAGISGARVCPISDGGHQLPLSHPDELGQIVTAWVNHVELRGG